MAHPLKNPALEDGLNWAKIITETRREDATPFVILGKDWLSLLISCPTLVPFYAFVLNGNRELFWRLQYRVRSQFDQRIKERNRVRNHRPDIAAKRKRTRYDRYHGDPQYRKALNAKGVERFKKNREAIYKYRKEVRSQWALESDREYLRDWHRNKRRTDPNYNLGNRLRSRIWHALNRHKKSASTEELTGCTLAELRAHLEKQFKPGMSWERPGEWHIDHRWPCARFDLSRADEQRACFHYTNLQPLWKRENLSKGGKIPNKGISH